MKAKGWQEFGYYSRSQRRGIYALIGLIALSALILIIAPWRWWPQPEVVFPESWLAETETEPTPVNWRPFDPNKLTADGFEKLGLSRTLAERIEKYRAKGGKFYRKADLQKIYGMDSAWYARARDYVQITTKVETPRQEKHFAHYQDQLPALHPDTFDLNLATEAELAAIGLAEKEIRGILSFREKFRPFEKPSDLSLVYNMDSTRAQSLIPFAKVSRADSTPVDLEPVNINQADSLSLIAIKGLGPYTAAKIIAFRDGCGGFHSLEQLLDIYAIDSARWRMIKGQIVVDTNYRRLDLNAASLEQLQRNPYIRYRLARDIVAFREEFRLFRSTEELKHLELINEQLFSKIAPYLQVE